MQLYIAFTFIPRYSSTQGIYMLPYLTSFGSLDIVFKVCHHNSQGFVISSDVPALSLICVVLSPARYLNLCFIQNLLTRGISTKGGSSTGTSDTLIQCSEFKVDETWPEIDFQEKRSQTLH